MNTPVGMGIDLVDLERVRKICDGDGMAFAQRICTRRELDYCFSRQDPASCLAARFAAKEAVAKALGTGIGARCRFQDVEVTLLESGAPRLVLHGPAAETAASMGIDYWMISLTHSRLSAAAVVIGLSSNAAQS